jgi:AcrR family transcriptional regulator
LSGSTKRDIVVEAAALFAERGFSAVSVQEIGARVGITGGAIYRHYASKDAVLHAVLIDTIERWLAVARDAERDGAGPQIERLVEASVQLVVDSPGLLATYVRERPRVERSVRHELAEYERQLFDRWAAAILTARPGLSRRDIVVRQQAINGVLSSLAERPALIAHPRLRMLTSEGLVAVATAPVGGRQSEVNEPRRAWTTPVPRREQIIATAMRLFAQRGYHGVSMDDIGNAVGMAGPSLYEHVAGKADILLDAYDRAGAFVIAGAAHALAGARSASDALDNLIASYVEVAFAHDDLVIVTSREGAALPASERPRLARRRRDLHEHWSVVLRELRSDVAAGDARTLVRSTLALVNALARQRRDGSPSVGETVSLGRAFLTGSPSEPRNTQEQP